MRGLLRCSLVWLLALSFAASGVAARQCAAAQQMSAVADGMSHTQKDQGHHGHAAQQAVHAEHDHAAMSHQHGSDDSVPMTQDDHACAKCCGICTLVVGMAPEVSAIAIFKVSPASFPAVSGHCCGTIATVDPGIPKRII